MLHPVGPLPAAVYWRRRVLVLTLLLSVLGGGGWTGYAVATGRLDVGTSTAAATSSVPPATPALERVVPSLAGVAIPTVPPSPTAATACTDAMIGLEVRTPGSAAPGAGATFELVVRNVAPVPCVRSLDEQLQHLVLFDAAGNRIWGSDDCAPGTSSDPRTLAPGEAVSFPVAWNGLTSEPTCTAPRVPLVPGGYLLQGWLGTRSSAATPLTIAQL